MEWQTIMELLNRLVTKAEIEDGAFQIHFRSVRCYGEYRIEYYPDKNDDACFWSESSTLENALRELFATMDRHL